MTELRYQPSPPVSAAIGTYTGFVLIALTNAIAIAVLIPWPTSGLQVRLLHHLFDASSVLGLGILASLAVGLWVAFLKDPWWAGLVAYAAVTSVIMHEVVGRDLLRQAFVIFNGRFERPIHILYLVLCGLAIPAAHIVGYWLSRFRRLRLIPVVLSIAALVTNQFVVRDDYQGVHGVVAWSAAILLGNAIAPWVKSLIQRFHRRTLIASILVLVSVFGLVVPPSNAVRLEMFRLPSAIGAWVLSEVIWSSPGPPADIHALPQDIQNSPWWTDRKTMLPIKPSSPPLVASKAPIVVFVTIDAMRADAIANPSNDRFFPLLAKLKASSAYFTNAVSPGSQTAVSLSSAFSGHYFSQLVWSMHGKGSMRFLYPAQDPATRFPQILASHGVQTASFCSINFLAGEYGVTRGFTEERVIAQGRKHAFAKAMIDPLLDRLRRADDGPLFVYTHLMEPHSPYDRGQRQGSDWERYLSEIRVADTQIARVSHLLLQKFPDRAFLVISSDHGEAFGEHGTYQHTKTLYDELVRVPLFIRGPRVVAQHIDQRVSLMDLGPTILDLFGVETPATWIGQSLVPLLAGQNDVLSRPVFAEGRLRRAFYWNELKLIDDPRRKVVEAYDLQRDPAETINLFDVDPARVRPALIAFRAFFEIHNPIDPGYQPLYKP